ncbi:3-oxoacyl-[acyl-carrier-protein] reductase [Desulfatirhabdium butyrativorans]|uniref:3-oxoacyl-[acyl-carrier-protein] reductase n=1 Tax=Desulfatirhabdium butyrativorans TaxID=340467 RepID=UPI0003F520F5|nr:3-oxoacyl-[acyl-carrier-protein] reductase [Desulfatirhabdium butyrativorans]
MARTVVVTGGSRGIGRAICLAFAGRDTNVFFNYASNREEAEATVRMAADRGGSATAIQADITDADAVDAFFKQILATADGIDVLVNNVGITRDGLLARMKPADWDAVIRTNLGGMFLCTRACVRSMLKKHAGRIINIGSVVGTIGNAGQANYAASKAGVVGFTKAVARELASRNITANVVAPGYIETDMTAVLNDQVKEGLMAQIPLGRLGKPEDVAAVVRFLASDDAAYITGQVIHVSGGMVMDG